MKTPPCERHKNLQMVPFFIEYTSGPVSGHVCPVPGCGRHHTENGYFDLADGKPAREEEPLKNKITLARDEIRRVIGSRAGA